MADITRSDKVARDGPGHNASSRERNEQPLLQKEIEDVYSLPRRSLRDADGNLRRKTVSVFQDNPKVRGKT